MSQVEETALHTHRTRAALEQQTHTLPKEAHAGRRRKQLIVYPYTQIPGLENPTVRRPVFLIGTAAWYSVRVPVKYWGT